MSEDERELGPVLGGYRYPLYRRNDRPLPAEWTGPIYVWDIDNTYLHTEYAGLRDLVRIRFEAAQDKRPVPGAVELLAALRRGAEAERAGGRPPIYFVSASPKTMRPVLEKRMLIDGVIHDGITFRDLYKLRYLRDIFGYKLVALLLLRRENPAGAEEHLFGDDREHDPLVYATYARICAGTLRGEALRTLLATKGVRPSAATYAAALADALPARDPVSWIFIRRLPRPGAGDAAQAAAASPHALPDDPRLALVDDYGEVAALLRAAGRIGPDDLRAVLRAVRARGLGHTPGRLLETFAPRLPAEGLAAAQAELAAEAPSA